MTDRNIYMHIKPEIMYIMYIMYTVTIPIDTMLD